MLYFMTHPFTWTVVGLLISLFSFRYFWIKTQEFLQTKDVSKKPTYASVLLGVIFACVFLWGLIISIGLIIWG